jgi:transposase
MSVIVSRKVSRLKLVATVDRLDPKIIAMEACGGRVFQEAGRMVRLINPYFVRPFVRGSKNDATDAQAILRGRRSADDALRAGEEPRSARICSRSTASATAWSTTAPR